jgi:hypothetical protein
LTEPWGGSGEYFQRRPFGVSLFLLLDGRFDAKKHAANNARG